MSKEGDKPVTVKPKSRRQSPKKANDQLIKDLKRNVDKIIDILPKEDVLALIDGQLAKRHLGLQSYMLDNAVSALFARGVQFNKKPFCKHEVGDPSEIKWALFRLDSEGERRFVKYITEEEAHYIDACG